MVCVFFGHRDTPSNVAPVLEKTVRQLIEERGVDVFYVGDRGIFDRMVLRILRKLKSEYPQIEYALVPAYQPTVRNEFDYTDYTEAVFPDEVLKSPKRYAIANRNRWLVKVADIVVTYANGVGYSSDYKSLAQKRKKEVIELANLIKENII